MRRGSLLGSHGRPHGKDRSGVRAVTQGGVLVALALILLTLLYPVEKVRRENKRLLAELSEAQLDLEAHQEALKISRERCDSKIKIFTENEVKYQQSIEYYKETDKRLSEEWCQKITDTAMLEYKQVCQRSIDSYVKQVEHLNEERDELIKRMEPISLCCKSATAKNKALMSGLDKESAKRKGAEAVAASIRAMRDPDTVRSHRQHVEWRPGGAQARVGESRRVTRDRVRLPGLGDELQSRAKVAASSGRKEKTEHGEGAAEKVDRDEGAAHGEGEEEDRGDLSDIIARAEEVDEGEGGEGTGGGKAEGIGAEEGGVEGEGFGGNEGANSGGKERDRDKDEGFDGGEQGDEVGGKDAGIEIDGGLDGEGGAVEEVDGEEGGV